MFSIKISGECVHASRIFGTVDLDDGVTSAAAAATADDTITEKDGRIIVCVEGKKAHSAHTHSHVS